MVASDTRSELAVRVSANLSGLLARDGRKPGAVASSAWPDVTEATAYRRLKRTLDDGWSKPQNLAEIADALGVDPSALFAEPGPE